MQAAFGAATFALPLAAPAHALRKHGSRAARRADPLLPDQFPPLFTVPFTQPPVLQPVRRDSTTDFYEIVQRPANVEIIPGLPTTVWGYNGLVPGPTIRAARGRETVVRQINALPQRHPVLDYEAATSTHLHGSPSLPQYDGYANDLTRPGEFKDYRYPNDASARTLWYHDHAVMRTSENVYMGLAGQYHIVDAAEDVLQLPAGRYDVSLTIADRLFNADGSLLFDDDGEDTINGDVILVNGRPWPVMQVERRKYRFRILNGSNGRGYRFTLSTGEPLIVIATDSSLMPAPAPVQVLRHGMAERYDVVIDFARYPIGQRVELRNLGVDNAEDFEFTDRIMAFDVAGEPTDTTNNQVPPVLQPEPPAFDLDPADAVRARHFEFVRQGGEWTINGETWAEVQASGFRAVLADPGPGDIEIWELQNNSGGWFHPVHLHLVDFRILDRNGRPPEPYENGAKDTVYVGEGDTIRIITRFGPHVGRYMFHCHNTTHEDHDMMHQFRVGPLGAGPDPITAAPPQPLPAPPL